MADQPRTDLLRAWLDSVGQLRSIAGSIADPPEAVHRLQELQEQVVGGLFLPVDTILQIADQLSEPLREQARAFERASTAFNEIAALLRRQADLLETAGGAVRVPTEALKSVVGAPERSAKGGEKGAPAKKTGAAKPREPGPKRPARKR